MESYILITGGLGFIGSHVIDCLLNSGYKNLIIYDNLSNSDASVLDNIKTLHPENNIIFIHGDVIDKPYLDDIFKEYEIEGVFHMAALKSVSESISNPLEYYDNNVSGTINVLSLMKKHNVKNFVFSSSATVYGNSLIPLNEKSKIGDGITNPYGQTKFVVEKILKDLSFNNQDFNLIILRYFNPIGAHPSGLLGENPQGAPNNIFPYIMKVANREYPHLSVYGNDYKTIDGTGVRDYIDINDLSQAHICAYNRFKHLESSYNVFNIGTGKGTSVLELIRTFEKASNTKIPYKICDRRLGDLPEVYCSLSAETMEILSWEPKYSLYDSCSNAWNFIKCNFDSFNHKN